MGASPPALVAELVERFERDRQVFLSPDYKEEQLRAEFLNPFFESLGWDVSNKAGLTEVFKPVIQAADSSQITAHSLRPSDPDFGPSAASRWPLALTIGSLYYPDCPYEFSVLPADILGQVYEQFLGKFIRLTPGHQAKVEEKPEGLVPTGALDRPSAPRKLSAVRSEPRPALTDTAKMVSVPDSRYVHRQVKFGQQDVRKYG
jgi:hypothetical protein